MSLDSKLELMQKAKEATAKTKAYERLMLLFDEGTFVELDAFAKSGENEAEALAGFGALRILAARCMRLPKTAMFPAERCPRPRPPRFARYTIWP